ncbi:diguanylate cyclase [Paucibacter sediminis]|uniref:diguanylate cyclase n=1 Tax=Paucibacter sediminis TaxID=3019553 RepID=A0AA95SN85_9BURK|nr:diguanylate cyclase [Paucibacter sp. S2-9]WIT14093.1 diguanylate cyclase [Paucibacter sp. S2-9]
MLPSSPSPLTILVIDDQSASRVAVVAELDRAGHRALEADSAAWGLELFKRYRPDLVLLDVEMPAHDGYWTARQIRAAEPGGWTPIIFLSQRDQDQDVWRGIEAGGDDYLVKPVSPMILHAKLRAMQRLLGMRQRLVQLSDELRSANAQLHELSNADALTGLMNRRALDERLHQCIAQARRDGLPLTLVLCDVDYFKRYNDSLGHVEGDACLKRVAALLREACRRPSDCVGRYGGEEFALILPNTPRSGAMTYARALIRTMALAGIPHPDSDIAPHITVSGGITTCVADASTTAEGLLLRADDALYNAKAHGRNRFFSYEMQMDTLEQRQPASARPLDK